MKTILNNKPARKIWSVTQTNRHVRQLIESQIPLIWVCGEISNLAQPTSGHWYFSLKDQASQVRCAMFRNRNQGVNFRPQNGQQIIIRAKAGLYEGRGEYQLVAEHMEQQGAGTLQEAFEQLKTRLNNEGLFDPSLKKALPKRPRHIGIITSKTGAAIHDIITVLRRRNPLTRVTLYPVPVQGQEAAQKMAQAIITANQHQQQDLLIIGRGGGSLEDLWCFNDEQLARSIFNSQIPIISAVGHETDTSISDWVADVRAPTPSAAAEIAVEDQGNWLRRIANHQKTLERQVQANIQKGQAQLKYLKQRLRHPKELLQLQAQTLDNMELRLAHTQHKQLGTLHQKHKQLTQKIIAIGSTLKNRPQKYKLQLLEQKLINLQKHNLQAHQTKLHRNIALLNSYNPLEILGRGYAVARNTKGRIITNSAKTHPGDRISITLAKGTIEATVNKT